MVSGTLTFLFTDIEGSTQRWGRDRDAMAAALRRHDALMRRAIAAHGGEIFKTVGDAFCAVFATAPARRGGARRAARAGRRRFLGRRRRVRAHGAAHRNVADERDGDYFGPTVNRVARLLAIGHGGQVLALRRGGGAAARARCRAQTSLRDLGAHRLKDLARPEHVYQLVAPGLPRIVSARCVRSTRCPTTCRCSSPRSSAATATCARSKRCSRHDRLVTLVGAGGVGKTRCAIQVGAELLDAFADGVWLVELARISDPSLVATAIAHALGVRESPNQPLLDTLLAHLKQRSTCC